MRLSTFLFIKVKIGWDFKYFCAILKVKRLFSIAVTVLLAGVLAFADDRPKIGQNYPNPAKERTFVDVEFNSSEATITLSNILGEIIYVQKVPRSGTYTINVTEIPEGVYFYTLAADGQKVTKKLTVKK